MGGPENLALMFNSMSSGGGARMAELLKTLNRTGTVGYADFCRRATPEQSEQFGVWIGGASPEHIRAAGLRLNGATTCEPTAFLRWLDDLTAGRVSAKPPGKWWQFWLRDSSSGPPAAPPVAAPSPAPLRAAAGPAPRPTASGVSFVATVQELRRLVGDDGGFGNEEPIRAIGERLHREGGMDLMQKAYYAVRNGGPYFSQHIWDGVGEWRA